MAKEKEEGPNQEQIRLYHPETGECKRFPARSAPGDWLRNDPNAEDESSQPAEETKAEAKPDESTQEEKPAKAKKEKPVKKGD